MKSYPATKIKSRIRASRALAPVVRAYDAGKMLFDSRHVSGAFSTTLKANLTDPDSYIFAHWWPSDNFGDAVSPMVVKALSKRQPLCSSVYPKSMNRECFSAVGSVLSFHAPPLTIWGSGFIRDDAATYVKPRKVCAVRGPLTRAILEKQGLECPEVFGDPAALVFDTFRSLQRRAKYKIGFIPHYHDVTNSDVQKFAQDDRVLMIDVFWPVERIAQAFADCEVVLSSSLHGLILADCMEVPNRWVGVSEFVLKGGFKFHDYFASVNREEGLPLPVANMSVERAINEAHCRFVPFSREMLLEACPFRSAEVGSLDDAAASIAELIDASWTGIGNGR